MKITSVECHVLVVNDLTVDATSAQDDSVVIVNTDEVISGVREADTHPWSVQALIKSPGTHNLARGLEEMIVGCDPLEVEALWDKMYTGSLMSGPAEGRVFVRSVPWIWPSGTFAAKLWEFPVGSCSEEPARIR